jgi:hypothetical protein
LDTLNESGDKDDEAKGSETAYPSHKDRKGPNDDKDTIRLEPDEKLGDKARGESIEHDREQIKDKNPGQGVPSPPHEPREPSAPIPKLQISDVRMISTEPDDKDRKKTPHATVTEKAKTAVKREDPSADSAPTVDRQLLKFISAIALPTAPTVAQPPPDRESTLNFTPPSNKDPVFRFPEAPPMSFANSLLFNEVFQIQEVKIQDSDHTYYLCRGLDEWSARCKSLVSERCRFGIQIIERSLREADGVKDSEIESLAMYNLCEAHTKQSAELAKEWIWLAKRTEWVRTLWQNQRPGVAGDSKCMGKKWAKYTAIRTRFILTEREHEKIGVHVSDRPLTKTVDKLTTENRVLKKSLEATKEALVNEEKRGQEERQNAKDLIESSQER